MVKQLVTGILAFCIGVLVAFGGLRLVPVLFPQSDIPSFASFAVKRPDVVGFLPYWLIGKADKQYSKYISTLTYFGLAVRGDGSVMKYTNPGESEPGWYALSGDALDAHFTDAEKAGVKKSLLIISGDDEAIRGILDKPETAARTMMSEVAPVMKKYGFTDLNIDIETFMEASSSARDSFTRFVRTVKNELVDNNLGSLTIDLIPISLVKSTLYDPFELGKIADAVVLMTYDYHYTGSFTSGSVAPIGGAGQTTEFDVETAVQLALRVMPAKKILLGIPLYGYQWETIESASESATIAGGSETISVRRVSELLRDCDGCVTGRDEYGGGPYVIYPEGEVFKQAYFEDASSMQQKLDLARTYRLGGVALWALGYEDDSLLDPLESYKRSIEVTW